MALPVPPGECFSGLSNCGISDGGGVSPGECVSGLNDSEERVDGGGVF